MSLPLYLALMIPFGGKSIGDTSLQALHRSRRSVVFSYVKFLRKRSSGVRSPIRKPTGNLNTMMEFGPKLRSTAVIVVSKPVRIAPTPMIVPVPIMTPSTVSKERILCARMVSSAREVAFAKVSPVIFSLFRAQGFDRVEFRGALGGVDPKEQPGDGRQADTDEHGVPRELHGNRRQLANQHRGHPGQKHTRESTGCG